MKNLAVISAASLAIGGCIGLISSAYAESMLAAQVDRDAVSAILKKITKVKGLRLASIGAGSAPSDVYCRTYYDTPCYSPQELQNAYGLRLLLSAGYTGVGQSIIIIDSFGSPTIAQDLAAFDVGYGIPDPPSLKVLAPLGAVPFDPTNSDMAGWAMETTLDVEWAHAMAPSANIVLLTSPVSETEGIQGLPKFLELEQYALDNKLGRIISQSWGATENTLFTPAGQALIKDFETFYIRAARESVTVLASAGDTGSANFNVDHKFYPFPTVNYPASSPWVTAVGGTSLYADTSGNYLSETVWDNASGAGGGGVSQYFAEPFYQRSLTAYQPLLQGKRGIPDVSYNADPETAILVYASFLPSCAGCYFFIGGTSEGSPQWAGIIADANQLARHAIGYLNPTIYGLNDADGAKYFHDITAGNNGFAGIPGYSAAPGWDLATGWGTPNLGGGETRDLGALVRALAQPGQPLTASNP
jgi:subtilase family serine protease